MTAYSSLKLPRYDVSAAVRSAAEQSAIAGIYAASKAAGDAGHHVDCIGVAHNLSAHGQYRHLDSAAFALEANMLDLALLQKACDPVDVIILCIVAAERMGPVEDRCDKDFRPVASGVAVALNNIAGYVILEHGREIIKQLPADLQDRAGDAVDNYTGVMPGEAEA